MQMAGWFLREVPPSLEDLLDDAAIQRIKKKTEAKKPIEWRLGADDLRIDLIWCFSQYRTLRSSRLARSRAKHLLKVAKAANDFVRLFDGAQSCRWSRNQIAGGLHAQGLSLENLLSAIRMVRKIASRAADPTSNDYAIVLHKISKSVFETIVAGVLLETFERHTGKRATRSRPSTGGEADSPFIRFAVSALKELDIRPPRGGTYKPETVARGLATSTGSRRKKK
jgi:hypothetical protein